MNINDDKAGVLGEGEVVIGGFVDTLRLTISGCSVGKDAYVSVGGGEVSVDQLTWSNRITVGFTGMYETIYVKHNGDLNHKMTIKVGQA